jgi:hypothetical protein
MNQAFNEKNIKITFNISHNFVDNFSSFSIYFRFFFYCANNFNKKRKFIIAQMIEFLFCFFFYFCKQTQAN